MAILQHSIWQQTQCKPILRQFLIYCIISKQLFITELKSTHSKSRKTCWKYVLSTNTKHSESRLCIQVLARRLQKEIKRKLKCLLGGSKLYKDCSSMFCLFVAGYGEDRTVFRGEKKWSEDSNPSWAPGSLRQGSFPGGYAELSMQAVITTYQHLCCCIMGRIQSSGSERNEWSRDRFSSVQFWEVCLHPSQFLFKSSRNAQMEKKVLLVF